MTRRALHAVFEATTCCIKSMQSCSIVLTPAHTGTCHALHVITAQAALQLTSVKKAHGYAILMPQPAGLSSR